VLTVTLALLLAWPLLTVNVITYVPATSTTKVAITLVAFCSVAALPGGREVNAHAYVKVPTPLGFVEPLPFNVTVLPTSALWLGPAFATGGVGVLWNVHASFDKSSVTVRSTMIVNEPVEGTVEFAGTGEKLNVSWPATTWMLGVVLVTLAVTAGSAPPEFTRLAVYVTLHCVNVTRCDSTA
jgi:hypothetical protein